MLESFSFIEEIHLTIHENQWEPIGLNHKEPNRKLKNICWAQDTIIPSPCLLLLFILTDFDTICYLSILFQAREGKSPIPTWINGFSAFATIFWT